MFDWVYSLQYFFPEIVVSAFAILVGMLVYVKIFWLRTFAKFTSVDFITTIMIGSILASTIILKDVSILQWLGAIWSVLIFQRLLTYVFNNSKSYKNIISNTPVFLYKDGKFQQDAFRDTHASMDILMEKLRQHNIHSMQQVSHIIFETTWNISILYSDTHKPVEPEILKGVL